MHSHDDICVAEASDELGCPDEQYPDVNHIHDHKHHAHHAHHRCCPRMHSEGETAEHILHMAEVRNAWLAAAMREAEEDDREEGVWDLAADKWCTGDFVAIYGLTSRPDLNGATGVLLHWVKASGRWGVAVINTDERVKVKPDNLRRLASAGKLVSDDATTSATSPPRDTLRASNAGSTSVGSGGGGGGGRTPRILQFGPTLAESVAVELAASHFAIVDGFLAGAAASKGRCSGEGGEGGEGGGGMSTCSCSCAAVHAVLSQMRQSGELRPGDVAGAISLDCL